MHTFDVVVWQGVRSDDTACYAAWCSYVLGVWGQGDTEEEALAEVVAMITDVINDPDDAAESLVDAEAAMAAMDNLRSELDGNGTSHWLRRVSVPGFKLAEV